VLPFTDTGPPSPADPVLGMYDRATRLARRVARLGASGIADRLGRRLRSVRPPTTEELWVALHCSQPPARNPLFSRSFVSSLNGYSPVDDYLSAFVSAPTTEILDKCLYHDLRCYLPALLHMEDRASMAVSVESRVPLIDHQLVEFMATVPPAQKVPGMQPKGLLRASARGVIPETIRTRRDKRNFPVPFDVWVRDVMKDQSRNILLSPQSLDRGIFDPDRLRTWDLSTYEIWVALNVEIWFREFLDPAR
jgi:asparagine synthase (glutamine-hydrolysing)